MFTLESTLLIKTHLSLKSCLGCWFHNHDPNVCSINKQQQPDSKWAEIQKERQERTRKKKEFTQSLGITYIEIYECEYRRLLRNDATMRAFVNSNQPTFYQKHKSSYKVTEHTILEAVLNDEVFGAVLVDIHVPEALYDTFSEFSPFFCTTNVPWEVIGDTMQHYWRETQTNADGEMKPFPNKNLLVGGMRASRILLSTPLLHFYLEKGLKVTKIYEVISVLYKQFYKHI